MGENEEGTISLLSCFSRNSLVSGGQLGFFMASARILSRSLRSL